MRDCHLCWIASSQSDFVDFLKGDRLIEAAHDSAFRHFRFRNCGIFDRLVQSSGLQVAAIFRFEFWRIFEFVSEVCILKFAGSCAVRSRFGRISNLVCA